MHEPRRIIALQRGSFMLWNGENLDFMRFSGIEKVHRNSIKITVDLWRRTIKKIFSLVLHRYLNSYEKSWAFKVWAAVQPLSFGQRLHHLDAAFEYHGDPFFWVHHYAFKQLADDLVIVFHWTILYAVEYHVDVVESGFAFSRRCSASAILPSCCCKRLFSFMRRVAVSSSKASTVSVDTRSSIFRNSASISAIYTWRSMLLSSLLSPSKPMPMRSFNVCSTAVFRAAVFMIAAITALCRMLSSTVGEFRQYFFPKSRRLMHRHTIFLLPPAVHVHRRYGVLHSPHTRSSVKAYLLEYLPCSVVVPFWIYNKKVDKYDKIEDRKRRNKKCLQKIRNTPRNISKQ